jgi:hypothetical protein
VLPYEAGASSSLREYGIELANRPYVRPSVRPSAARQSQTPNPISSSFATQCSAYVITIQHRQEKEFRLLSQHCASSLPIYYVFFHFPCKTGLHNVVAKITVCLFTTL